MASMMGRYFTPESREFVAPVLLVAALLALTVSCQYFTAGLRIHLEITAAQDDALRVYWRKKDSVFEAANSQQLALSAEERSTFDVTLPMALDIDYIRIDPGIKPGDSTLSKAVIFYGWNHHIDLLAFLRTHGPLSTHQISLLHQTDSLLMTSQGNDPFIELQPPINGRSIFMWQHILPAAAAIALSLCLLLHQRYLKGSKTRGQLQLTVPHQGRLVLPDLGGAHYRVDPFISRGTNGREETYGVNVYNIEPALVADLILRFRQVNTSATIRFQYHRAGAI